MTANPAPATGEQALTRERLERIDAHTAQLIGACLEMMSGVIAEAFASSDALEALPEPLLNLFAARVKAVGLCFRLPDRTAALDGADPETYQAALEADIHDARRDALAAQRRLSALCERAALGRRTGAIGQLA